MHVSMIRYTKLTNTGNYEHEKLTVEVVLNEGDNPAEAVRRAREFVAKMQEASPKDSYEVERAKRIVADPDNHSPRQLRDAQQLIDGVVAPDEIPF